MERGARRNVGANIPRRLRNRDSEQMSEGSTLPLPPEPSLTRTMNQIPNLIITNSLSSGSMIHNERTAAGIRRRIKWTKDMNIEVMRTFYETNICNDSPLPGWRRKFHLAMTEKFPNLNLSEQNVVDRRSVIIKKQYLNRSELDEICRQAGNTIYQREHFDDEVEIQIEREIEVVPNDIFAENELILDDTYQHIEAEFLSKIELFDDTNPLTRPKIPNLNFSSYYKIKGIFDILDKIINLFLESHTSIYYIHLTLYCAATLIIEKNGQTLLTETPSNKETKEPIWKIRLNKKVNNLRKDIGILTAFKNNFNTVGPRKINQIFSKYKLNRQATNFEINFNDNLDILKQKLKVTAHRLKRYTNCTQRKFENKIYLENSNKFFRYLEPTPKTQNFPQQDNMLHFWSNLWCQNSKYNKEASWIEKLKDDSTTLEWLEGDLITLEEITNAIRFSSNWKSPGLDGIHNFWLKKFKSVHLPLLFWYNEALNDPSVIPEFLCTGVTYMLYKNGNPLEPQNYRPITCLPTIYKIFTSILASKIENHCKTNNVMCMEQKGCVKGSQGCRELLIVDTIITKLAKDKKRNLHMCFIDYKKAYDSVPHDWLIDILIIYKIDPKIIRLLSSMMSMWNTLVVNNGTKLESIKINRGIFQGDSLSALWFCLAINPLSTLLNDSTSGFRLNFRNNTTITHLLYMDDLKLYSRTEDQLQNLIECTKLFSRDICMEFGFDKCAKINITSGNPIANPDILNEIPQLLPNKFYKYLGMQQNFVLNHTFLKNEFKQKYIGKLKILLKSKLNSRNMISAINSWAVPVLSYSFGVLKWSNTDLNAMDTLTRKMLYKYRYLHPKSAVERLYIKRKNGGRGLINLFNICKSLTKLLRDYFYSLNTPLIQEIINFDKHFSGLNLKNRNLNCEQTCDLDINWKNKVLHGKHPTILDSIGIDKEMSVEWLKRGVLHLETEGFMCAIQDGVIATNNYKKHIMNLEVSDHCRKCNLLNETIEHVIAGCSYLAPTDYLRRHNQVCKILHQQIAKKVGLLSNFKPYYDYIPEPVLENESSLLYWDRLVLTDREISHNRPDIVLISQRDRNAIIIDVAVPLSKNVLNTEKEKIRKYEALAMEMMSVWGLTKISIIPIVISATGVVSSKFKTHLSHLDLSSKLFPEMQKAVILETCHIVRKFLNATT